MSDLFGYPHSPGAKARETAFEAADEIASKAPIIRARCLKVLEHSNGLTADEVAGRLGLSILTVRPRITELARDGKVRDSGDRRRNVSGKRAIVWTPVNPARLKGGRRDR